MSWDLGGAVAVGEKYEEEGRDVMAPASEINRSGRALAGWRLRFCNVLDVDKVR